jgi:hypothetical protein
LTCINDQADIKSVRSLLDLGVTVRHVKNLPLTFTVSNREMNVTVERPRDYAMISNLVISTERPWIEPFQTLFEEIWIEGVDAVERIREIESGFSTSTIEIIGDPQEAVRRAWEKIEKAQDLLVMFSTPNALRRQVKAGALEALNHTAAKSKQSVHPRF